jgi:hypothetical protein
VGMTEFSAVPAYNPNIRVLPSALHRVFLVYMNLKAISLQHKKHHIYGEAIYKINKYF